MAKINFLSLILVILNVFANVVNAQDAAPSGDSAAAGPAGPVFDVTKYGPIPSKDLAPALLAAWKEACNSPTGGKIVIPKGDHPMGPVKFAGPCKGPIMVDIGGNFIAPASVAEFKGEDTWVRFTNIAQLTLEAQPGVGVFDGKGEEGWKSNNAAKTGKLNLPYNFRFETLTDSVIRGITSKDSKLFHSHILGGKNILVENYHAIAPEDSLNTDGIHVARAENVRLINSDMQTGDDCVSMGDGLKNFTVENISCGPGHGISVGSMGRYDNEGPIAGIFVKNCSFKSTQNGVRIKSWMNGTPAEASDMHFEDITVDNVTHPVIIDQCYCPYKQCKALVPSKVKLSNISFKNVKGTSAGPAVMRLIASSAFPPINLELTDIDVTYTGPLGPAISQCVNIKPVVSGKVNPPACNTPVEEKPEVW